MNAKRPEGKRARSHPMHLHGTNWKRGITLMIIEKSSYSARQSEKSFPHKSKIKLQI
jgi:hypothetical protein